MKIEKHLLHLAGEYRVCSELQKRGILATVTYARHKGVDIFAIDERRSLALRIEVKTSQTRKFVTRIGQRQTPKNEAPDFWVLVQILRDGDTYTERFFILSDDEISEVQTRRNKGYAVGYVERHGKQPDVSKGVDNVSLDNVIPFEDQWSKIAAEMKRRAKPC